MTALISSLKKALKRKLKKSRLLLDRRPTHPFNKWLVKHIEEDHPKAFGQLRRRALPPIGHCDHLALAVLFFLEPSWPDHKEAGQEEFLRALTLPDHPPECTCHEEWISDYWGLWEDSTDNDQ